MEKAAWAFRCEIGAAGREDTRHADRKPAPPADAKSLTYVQRSFAQIEEDPEVYHTMNGPSEFHVVGRLKDWDIIDRLGGIHVPTLVLSGRYDEATPLIAETVQRGIPGAEWVVFEESSHMPHVEETARYLQVLDAFLTHAEQAFASPSLSTDQAYPQTENHSITHWAVSSAPLSLSAAGDVSKVRQG